MKEADTCAAPRETGRWPCVVLSFLFAEVCGGGLGSAPSLFGYGALARGRHRKTASVTEFSNTNCESIGSTSSSLLDRVKANDQDAWRRLVKLYSPLVLFWCRRAGIPTDDRADVFQDVFRAVTRHIGNFQRERSGSFRAWLRSIVSSKVADHFGRHVAEIAAGGTEARRRLMEIPDAAEDSVASCDPSEETLLIRQGRAKRRSRPRSG
ncbi:MAG: RNA polymerase sigma factor [Thermoguttaceae bacterium]